MKQITFVRPRDANFTPRSLMRDYAQENALKICYGRYGELYLRIGNHLYKYGSWRIEKIPDKREQITMFLTEVND